MKKRLGTALQAPLCLTFSGQGHREEMEDCLFVHEGRAGALICVCDGHGEHGAEAATMALTHMARLSDELLSEKASEFARALAPEFGSVHSDILSELGPLSGAAVLVARIVGHSVALAHAGDVEARIMSSSGDSWRALTRPHRLTNMDERFRISGEVPPDELERFCRSDRLMRDGKCLQLTRGVGSSHFDPVGHIAAPAMSVDWLDEGESLIVGTDGLWDRAIGMLPHFEPGNISSLARCLERRCASGYREPGVAMDNYACVVASARA